MSVELKPIGGFVEDSRCLKKRSAKLSLVSFFGGKEYGMMLQLTPPLFDYIQLTKSGVRELIEELKAWVEGV